MKKNTEIDFAMADIVNAFLKWPLPESVASDTCCNRPGKGRTGTNLLTCPETVAMVQEVVRPIVAKLIEKQRRSAAPANVGGQPRDEPATESTEKAP